MATDTITQAPPRERLYKTSRKLKRTVRIAYPAGMGRMVLHTELDWDKGIEAVSVSEDGNISTFELEADQPFLYFKPCLVEEDGSVHWSQGSNKLLLLEESDQRIVYPFFFSPENGRFSELIEFPSAILDRPHQLRVYLPPGYEENTLATYAVAFMQDGQNLFFPEEAFLGQTWEVDQTSKTLRAMSLVDDFVIIGIRSGDRMKEYTAPGYEAYARSLAEEIVPEAQRKLRIGNDRRHRSVWGSSLGGVVSFYTVWQYPEVFGVGVCMSSTFSHKDNLIERVLTEPVPDVGFYLDSGWPGDNYEVTMAMAMALVSRGFRYGHNLFHLSFPNAVHDEASWGMRLHLPMQFMNGAVARAARMTSGRVLGESPWS
ncbi:MAG: alpha/beta hydrolase-fold protein [Chitinophagaceae bacterium]|nr:alpha/beta hydrolase-fold protein [Chitinophagaceae bacterium]